MKNKIVLFYPDIMLKDEFTLDKNLRTIVKIPLSLLAISSLLDKDGYEIIIIDERISNNYLELVLENLKSAICLGISSMLGYQIKNGLDLSKIVKEKYPHIPIVWGGWHPTMLPEQTVKSPYVDYVVCGQGEKSFYNLIKFFEKKIKINDIPGIFYKKNNKIKNTSTPVITKLSELPDLPYHLIDLEKYFKTEPIRIMPYVSSNGCPWECGFCCIRNIYGRKWYPIPAKKIISDIIFLKEKYNIELIDFFDTNTFTDKNRIKEMCLGLIEKKINIKWWGSVRADQLKSYDNNFINLLKESGCSQLSIGGESGDQNVLDMLKKNIKVSDIISTVKKLKKINIPTAVSFIVGLPKKDVDQDFYKTQKLVLKLQKINPNIGIQFYFYIPNIGTPLYKKALEFGFKEPDTLEAWANLIYQEGANPWLSLDFVKKVNEFRNKVSDQRLYDIELKKYRKEIYNRKIIEFLKKLFVSKKINKNKKILIYGASETGILIKDFLFEKGIDIIGFGDKFQYGNFINGKNIFSIKELKEKKINIIIIASLGYSKQIYNEIKFLEEYKIEILEIKV